MSAATPRDTTPRDTTPRDTAPAGGQEHGLARPGSVRHSLIELAVPAVLAEVLFALVGGWPGAGAGAVLLAVVALLVARRVAGADVGIGSLRRRPRQMEAYEPGLGDWRWTVRQGLDPKGDAAPLRFRLQRLYAVRLSEVHGLDLSADRDRAAELLGPRLWPWIDPLAPTPTGPVPAAVLRELVDRLDSL
ncbi:hypothetical protein ACFQ6N_04235 [Kitasatospora sp. NPDC056446]|uniref:hypothetical protein n=1 Tax=Kitasatospora sp. NPDC056446 TaxID=3345819 RepID=UPI0036B64410